jgi:putative endonuclease
VTSESTPSPRDIGRAAEQAAGGFLRRRGYRIVESNVQYRLGEIDLVALDGDTLVFVEVRARRSSALGTAAESIDYRKQQRINRAIMLYLEQNAVDPRRPLRIDVVAIRLDDAGQPAAIDLIKNAFGEM